MAMHEAINHAKLAMLFRREFQLCNVQKGETIVLLSDLGARRDYVSAAFAAAEDLGADAYEMCVNAMPSWTKVGVETVGRCKGTLDAIMAANMLVCLHIPLFTRWLKVAREAGTRVLMVIDGPDELEELMAPPGLKEAVIHAGERLKRAKTMRVTRSGGTDLTVSLGEYPTMIQYGFAEAPGRFDHWGAGHVHTFPNEGSANGTVVFTPGDIVVLPYCRYVQDEVRLDIGDGFIHKIEGGLDAKLMSDWLDSNRATAEDTDGHAISHLGWGLNPQGRWDAIALNGADPRRHHASARCFAGNFLFSTGPNSQGGGKRTTKGHYDVPMRECTVALDNDVIIDRGGFADEKMRVTRVAM
jgi:2,5-dihydroxypyridine 5,6-dioxygenase